MRSGCRLAAAPRRKAGRSHSEQSQRPGLGRLTGADLLPVTGEGVIHNREGIERTAGHVQPDPSKTVGIKLHTDERIPRLEKLAVSKSSVERQRAILPGRKREGQRVDE